MASIKKDKVDVVLVGFGWMGAIMGQELTNDGVSLAGVQKVLELEAEVERLRTRVSALEAGLEAAHEAREAAVRDVHRSYRRDLVPVSRAVVRVPRR